MIDDAELLRRYAAENSESAFADFVQRRVNFVYACALRRVGGDAHFAEDVTQQVFVSAARQAAALARHPVLTGWLYTATRNVAAQLIRGERRRIAREQEAETMHEIENSGVHVDWERLRPVLDDALDHLDDADRQAVLLRFFEGRSFGEVGAQLRLAENAARMRVNRALEKLSAELQERGVTSTASALAVVLASQPAVAAPAGLAAMATGAALLAGGAANAGGAAAAVFMGMTKLQLGVASVLVATGIAGFAIQARESSRLSQELVVTTAQVQANVAVGAENVRLKQLIRQADETERAKAAELLALQAETKTKAAAAVAPERRSMPVFDMKNLDVQPKPRVRTAPQFPFAMRRSGQGGEAVVDFIVDKDGVVQNAKAIKATTVEFGVAAVEAVQKWKFTPGQKAGENVATHLQVPIVFELNNNSTPPPTPQNSRPSVSPWF